ncbi:DNA-binding protein [Shewanella algae]|uniref:DNA-binding protein n=1 Tax=Shewanella algae TaxID=38313 RepID=UPI00399A6765
MNSSDLFTSSVHPAEMIRAKLMPSVFGITAECARKYRERGFWLEGKHWQYDPVGRVVYNIKEIELWMKGEVS